MQVRQITRDGAGPMVAAALAASLMLNGCVAAAIGAAGTVAIGAAKDTSLGRNLDDSGASAKIRSLMLSSQAGSLAQVGVEVTNGLVLLTGNVATDADRLAAERIAWSAGSVTGVANEIAVGTTKRSSSVAAQDQMLSTRVKSRLISDPLVKGINFNVETYDGVVYLLGIARTEEEVARVADIASRTGGVKKVVVYIDLAKTPPATP